VVHRGGSQGGALSQRPLQRKEDVQGRCLTEGESLHCAAPSRASLAHADPACYTRVQDSWKQGVCGTPQAGKRGAVSDGQPDRNERLSIVEVRA